jgi:hypothetical protein
MISLLNRFFGAAAWTLTAPPAVRRLEIRDLPDGQGDIDAS